MTTSREYNTSRRDAGLPLVRFDLRRLDAEDILDLRHAYEALYEISSIAPGDRRGFWAIARGHGYDQDLCHQDPQTFLPWHRAYVYVFEKMLSAALQRRRGDDGVLTLPYWDWTVFDPDTDDANGIPRVLSDSEYVDPTADNETKPNPLASGPSMWRTQDVSPQQPLTRRYVTSSFRPGIAGFAQRIENFLTSPQFSNFMTFQSAFDGNPHGTVHVRVGGRGDPDTPGGAGDLSSVVSAAYDPIFWLHHCMVDKVWFDWQQVHGNSTIPSAIRSRGVYSVDNQPWTVEDTIDSEDLFNYTYGLAPLGGRVPPSPEGLEAALPPTLTVDIGRLANGVQGALLHLHSVTPPTNSYELRIFVNPSEEPTPETPTTTTAGYADSIFFFGHGRCTGAPGHCDPNAEERGPFDRRGGHPLSPRNYIADLTEILSSTDSGREIQLWFVLLDPLGNSVPTGELDVGSLSITEQ